MKKFWKIIGIIAVTGLCLTIIGKAMGANTGGFYIDQKGLQMYSGEYTRIHDTDIGEISSINIDTASVEIRFIQADDYGLEIYCRENASITHRYENGKLEIEQRATSNFLMMGFVRWEQEYINIYLPDGAQLDAVDIKNSSGEINIDSLYCKTFFTKQLSGNTQIGRLEADNATIKSSSGKVSIKSGKAGQFDFDLTSGNLIATDLVSNGLKAELSSGKAELSGTFSGNTNIKITSGDLLMKINGVEQEYNRNMNLTSGKVSINGIRAGEGQVNFNAGNNLDIRMSSGDVDIEFLR